MKILLFLTLASVSICSDGVVSLPSNPPKESPSKGGYGPSFHCDSPYNNPHASHKECLQQAWMNVPTFARDVANFMPRLKNNEALSDRQVKEELTKVAQCGGCNVSKNLPIEDIMGLQTKDAGTKANLLAATEKSFRARFASNIMCRMYGDERNNDIIAKEVMRTAGCLGDKSWVSAEEMENLTREYGNAGAQRLRDSIDAMMKLPMIGDAVSSLTCAAGRLQAEAVGTKARLKPRIKIHGLYLSIMCQLKRIKRNDLSALNVALQGKAEKMNKIIAIELMKNTDCRKDKLLGLWDKLENLKEEVGEPVAGIMSDIADTMLEFPGVSDVFSGITCSSGRDETAVHTTKRDLRQEKVIGRDETAVRNPKRHLFQEKDIKNLIQSILKMLCLDDVDNPVTDMNKIYSNDDVDNPASDQNKISSNKRTKGGPLISELSCSMDDDDDDTQASDQNKISSNKRTKFGWFIPGLVCSLSNILEELPA